MRTSISRRRASWQNSKHVFAEPLEGRVLLSATWSTVSTSNDGSSIDGMGADRAGNIYAVGSDLNAQAIVRQKVPGGNWATIFTDPNLNDASFNSVATDAAGNVFVEGDVGSTLERPAGQSGFKTIDNLPNSYSGSAVATDAAGDVFTTGDERVVTSTYSKGKTTTIVTDYGVVRKLVPDAASPTGFDASTVYQRTGVSFGEYVASSSITVVGSGSAAGIYAVGGNGGTSATARWNVIKSTNGGASWSPVDQFYQDANVTSAAAFNVVGDSFGHIYVSGVGDKATLSGYTRNKTPIYSYTQYWMVRESAGGNSGSWSTVDTFLPAAASDAAPQAMGTDAAGNVYVAGCVVEGSIGHAIIRSNAAGSWSTKDDFTGAAGSGASYNGFTTDSAGNLYAAGNDDSSGWFIRSQPTAPTNLTAATDSISGSSQIDLSWSNAAGSNQTGFAIYRSTSPDPTTFTQVASLGAGTTSYIDSGLTSGTTYYYYVVSLLNATGQSNNSNTASAATSV